MQSRRTFALGLVAGIALTLAAPLAFEATRSADAAPAAASARATAAAASFKLHSTEFAAGTGRLEDVYTWSRRWFEAERATNPAAAKDHLARMKALDSTVKTRASAGMSSASETSDSAFYVAEATDLAATP